MPPENPLVETAAKFYPTSDSTEPSTPTGEPVTKAEDQTPTQESEKVDNPEDQIIDPEKENDDSDSEESETHDDDEDHQYIELDGTEHDLNEVREWKQGYLRQSDYTRKTQTLADDRRTFEAEREQQRAEITETRKKLSEQSDLLEILVQEDEAVDWEALKDEDLELYVEKKEQAEKRREALAKIKAERNTPIDDPATIQAEQKKFVLSDPAWVTEKDGKKELSEQYFADMTLINTYAGQAGFTPEEFSQMTKAHYLITILKAAKYDALQKRTNQVKEKRTKVPIVTKPGAKKQKGNQTAQQNDEAIINAFYPNG